MTSEVVENTGESSFGEAHGRFWIFLSLWSGRQSRKARSAQCHYIGDRGPWDKVGQLFGGGSARAPRLLC